MTLHILNQIASTSKTTEKLKIVKLNSDNELLKTVFRLAYNTRISFGIKKIPELQLFRGIMLLERCLDELENRFGTRQITGNAAVNRLQEMMGSLNEYDREVLRRVVLRDLECGCSEGTANKVWKDLIPSQPCMKASSQSDKTLANINYPAIAQLKADGTRCMIIKEGGEVTAWSRNGKPFIGIDNLLKLVADSKFDNLVLDGELVYNSDLNKVKKPQPFNNFCNTELKKPHADLSFLYGDNVVDHLEVELSKAADFQVADRQTGNGIVGKSIKGTLTEKEAEGFVFQCWDVIDAHDYWNGKSKIQYKHRMQHAESCIIEINSPHFEWIETHVVHSLNEAKVIYQSYIDQNLEGIILKNYNGIWEDKRSKDQVKFKAVIDVDMIIIGHYAHDTDPNKLGGLTIRSKCGLIQCNVGSGFKDGKASMKMEDRDPLDRTLLMANALSLYDSVLECECNGAIKRKKIRDGEAPYKLFLPIAKIIRLDKNAVDSNTYEEIFG